MRALVTTLICALWVVACSPPGEESTSQGSNPAPPGKADLGKSDPVAWANQFFLTQIQDDRWNPEGIEVDAGSNNCGPASMAMLMAARGLTPPGLTPEQASAHARALMHPDYPEIDAGRVEFPQGMDITIVVSRGSDEQALSLLTSLGMPFAEAG